MLALATVASQPSTDRASTITRAWCAPLSSFLKLAVSAVNRPSKYDHMPSYNLQIRLSEVSAVNRPSKYDHARTPDGPKRSVRLGRQPTEQVRS